MLLFNSKFCEQQGWLACLFFFLETETTDLDEDTAYTVKHYIEI